MHGATQWQQALQTPRAQDEVRIAFARLGVVAHCRPLSAGEVAECAEMGRERGARYALYLSCDAIAQAGQSLHESGEVLSPLDITERIAYADLAAAAAIIFSISGADAAQVRVLAPDEREEDAFLPAVSVAHTVAGEAASALTFSENGDEEALGLPVLPALPTPFSAEGWEGAAQDAVVFSQALPSATPYATPRHSAGGVENHTPSPAAAQGRPVEQALSLDALAQQLVERLQDAAATM